MEQMFYFILLAVRPPGRAGKRPGGEARRAEPHPTHIESRAFPAGVLGGGGGRRAISRTVPRIERLSDILQLFL